MLKESDERWAERMTELQRQIKGPPACLDTIIAAGTRCGVATETEIDLPQPKVSPHPRKGRPTLAKRLKQPHQRRPVATAGHRLNRRARPTQVPGTAIAKRRPMPQKTKELSRDMWNLDALHMFYRQCKLDMQLCPYVRRCGRTVPPSSRGGHWLLPQSVVLSCLRAIWIVIQVLLMHALLIARIFW
jgi:hypothetical protein